MKKLFIIIAVLLSVYCSASAPTDYFRTIASGEWNDPLIWESSADNITWLPTGSAPNSSANTITIRNTHSVFVSNNQDMDQVVIENGGILTHLDATLTINDGAGDDINVQSGGAFTLAAASNPPVFALATATANISPGGILRVSAGGLMFAGTGVNASNYVYQDSSILEYTLSLSFPTAGVTYFPNVNATTIPIFRTTDNVGIVGANTATVINGLFECNGSIIFQNTGTKTFRNGITGTGSINGSTSGKFIINGLTAKLGGSGTLTVATGTPMEIGNNTSVTMVSHKQVTGNINLLATAALIYLGNYNLDLTGNITGGSVSSHVVTNGTGKLILNNISGATPRIFPIGASSTTINPIAIFNGGGFSYGARVETGINPTIAVPVQAVNRTWFVTPTGGTPGTVNTNFFYALGDANAGFNYTANVELGQYTGVWNVIQPNLMPAGSYQVATTVSTYGDNIEAPLVLANLGAILATQHAVDVNYFTGVKEQNTHLLKWKLTCNGTAQVRMSVERRAGGSDFMQVHTEDATVARCEQPFSFIDNSPAPGVNYYRLKINDDAGNSTYSSIISLVNSNRGIDVMNIAPNPVVNGSFDLKIGAAYSARLRVTISDLQGRIYISRWQHLIPGSNVISFDVRGMGKGTYQVCVQADDGTQQVLRLLLQ